MLYYYRKDKEKSLKPTGYNPLTKTNKLQTINKTRRQKTMARFSVNDADKFGGQGGTGYFSLKNDKDVARVRFLFDTIEDVEGYAVHEVTINDKKRYVNCLREYGRPISDCPFCRANKFTAVKYFIPLYNEDTNKVQTWERGKKFGAKISSMCSRYTPVSQHTFEIERNGKAGDQTTTYEIYETGSEPFNITDIDIPDPLGTLVLDKSASDLEYYLSYGEFPADDSESIHRRASTTDNSAMSRRTPGRRESF